MTNEQLARYTELSTLVRRETEESGIKLDLNCPCDRAILSECGLTEGEVFELLSLYDLRWGDVADDTRRIVVGKW